MAKVCNTCLAVVPDTSRGRCPTCAPLERPSSGVRYPSEYQRNRRHLLAGGAACFWCGADATTADHLQPRADGGGHHLANLVPSCGPCNYRRGQAQRRKGTT